MIMNTRDKEITDQPRLNHFDLKSNSTCNIYTAMQIAIVIILLFFTHHRKNMLHLDRFKVAGILVIKLSMLSVLLYF